MPTFLCSPGLSPEDLDEMLREGQSVRYPKGTNVFQQDEDAHSFFVLLHGHLRVMKLTPDGQQVVVRFVMAGRSFRHRHGDGPDHLPRDGRRGSGQHRPRLALLRLAPIDRPTSRARGQYPADRREPPSGCPHARGRDVDGASGTARRPRPPAPCQASRTQGRGGSADRLSRFHARTSPR